MQDLSTAEREMDLIWNFSTDYADSEIARAVHAGRFFPGKCFRTVKSNPHRSVKMIEMNGSTYYLKEHFPLNFTGRLKERLLGTRASVEWRAIKKMRNLGFHTPEAVAYAEGRGGDSLRSILITLALEDAENLRIAIESRPYENRLKLLKNLGVQLRVLHDRGVYHRDLQPGNIFVEEDGEGFRFYFLDLHKAFFRGSLTQRLKTMDIGRLVFNLGTFARPEEIKSLLDGYTGSKIPAGIRKKIYSHSEKLRDIRKKSRSTRCLENSTRFSVERTGNFRLFRRRELEASFVLEMIDDFKTRNNSVIRRNGESYYIKETKSPGLWQNFKDMFQRPRGRRAWHGANALVVRNIGTPEPLALVEELHSLMVKKSWLMTRYMENSRHLAKYVHDRFVMKESSHKEACLLTDRLIEALASLYEENIYHGDLKATNILVKGDAVDEIEFLFIDLDGNHLWRRPHPTRIAKNLVQLYCSLPYCFSDKIALRFFVKFLRRTGLKEKLGPRLQEIVRKSTKRRERWIATVRKYGKIL